MMKINNVVRLNTIFISAVCFAAVWSYVNIFVLFFAACVLIANFFGLKEHKLYLPRFLANTLGLIVLFSAFLNFSIADMNVIFINALIVLMGLKLMEDKQYRDYMQISLMAVFILAGLSLLNLSMVFLVYLLLEVLLIIFQMVLLTAMVERDDFVLKKSLLYSLLKPIALIMIISVPSAAFLFVILPRTDYPMLSFLNNRQNASTGFSDSIQLGGVRTIQDNDKTAFRVKMDKIEDDYLYWRGVVLDTYTDNGWKSTKTGSVTKHGILHKNPADEQVGYRVFLEPTANKYLYTLNMPVELDYSEDFDFYRARGEAITEKPVKSKISYEGVSYITREIKTDIKNKKIYLQSSGVSGDVKKLAKSLEASDKDETVGNILDYLSPPEFKYSLENLEANNEPLKHFLTVTKRGNCEYFASAMGVLLRLNGIPARLVGGFRGGYYDKTAGYYSVLYSNAHVWVEAYIDGAWRRYDPTPADFSRFTDKNKLSGLREIKLFFDKLSYYWTVFVINYDFSKQMEGIKNIGEAARNASDLNVGAMLKTMFAVVFSAFLIFTVFTRRKRKSRSKRVLEKFDKVLTIYGEKRASGEGLLQAVDKIGDRSIYSDMKELVDKYYAEIYGEGELKTTAYKLLRKELSDIARDLKHIKKG